jgi:hypothetical protein
MVFDMRDRAEIHPFINPFDHHLPLPSHQTTLSKAI